MPNLIVLVLQILIIVATARWIGLLFLKFRQPRVMGEMVAGILLGPSCLGWFAPQISAWLFPPASLGHISAISQIGLIIFMFLIGLSLNSEELHGQGHA
ncbi:MAG: cation:proton antiporter, partial [Bryobacteraceae bacterium]